MDKQIQDRYDELADQNKIGISYHVYHLLSLKEEACIKKHGLLVGQRDRGTTRLPSLAAPAHIPCARGIIAYCVEFGKENRAAFGRQYPNKKPAGPH